MIINCIINFKQDMLMWKVGRHFTTLKLIIMEGKVLSKNETHYLARQRGLTEIWHSFVYWLSRIKLCMYVFKTQMPLQLSLIESKYNKLSMCSINIYTFLSLRSYLPSIAILGSPLWHILTALRSLYVLLDD